MYSAAEGQGVCDCQDNTAGIMCETCRTGYYVDMTLMQTDPNVCKCKYTYVLYLSYLCTYIAMTTRVIWGTTTQLCFSG